MNLGRILLSCLVLTGVTLVIGIVAVGYAPTVRAQGCAVVDADGTLVTRCISLAPATASGSVGGQHTVTATVTDDGTPAFDEEMWIRVESGPNTGKFASGASNVNGQVLFTYTDDGGAGTDAIAGCLADFAVSTTACFNFGTPGTPVFIADTATMEWVAPTPTPTPTPTPPPTGDTDGDGVQNAVESACGSNPASAASLPERIDGAFANVDDDVDTQVDEALPGGAEIHDCDRDGFVGTSEGSVGTNDQDPCGNNGWPAELVGNDNILNIGDFNSFLFPLRGVNDGHGTFNKFGHTVPDSDLNIARWNLDAAGSGAATINIGDLNALNPSVQAPTARPPMLGGLPAFFTNGGQCPWAP